MLALVRIASEINMKSGRVKARFLRALIRNMKAGFRGIEAEAEFQERWSRIFVSYTDPAALGVLTRTFGVGSVSPIEYECSTDFAALDEMVLRYVEVVRGKSFRVKVKRAGVEGFTSQELEQRLGAILHPHASHVDLKNPEVTIGVEVRPEGAFFYSKKIPGPGGLPLGVEGRALCLISGGFDSPVAAWLLMKRGVAVDFLFCNLSGDAYERSVLAVTNALVRQWSHGYRPRLFVSDFNPVADALKTHVKPSFVQVVLKRAMYRVANLVANRLGDCPALITGEAMGQVSSQTLHNLAAIEGASERIVLRPLIGMDKEEIIERTRRIGTYVFSAGIKEICALVPKNNVVACNRETIQREENKLPEGIWTEATKSCRMWDVLATPDEEMVTEHLFTDEIPVGARILDCRPEHYYTAWHYPQAERWNMEDVLVHYRHWNRDVPYVMYCPTGLQTAVAAELMQKAGFTAHSFRGGTRALIRYSEKQEQAVWS